MRSLSCRTPFTYNAMHCSICDGTALQAISLVLLIKGSNKRWKKATCSKNTVFCRWQPLERYTMQSSLVLCLTHRTQPSVKQTILESIPAQPRKDTRCTQFMCFFEHECKKKKKGKGKKEEELEEEWRATERERERERESGKTNALLLNVD